MRNPIGQQRGKVRDERILLGTLGKTVFYKLITFVLEYLFIFRSTTLILYPFLYLTMS